MDTLDQGMNNSKVLEKKNYKLITNRNSIKLFRKCWAHKKFIAVTFLTYKHSTLLPFIIPLRAGHCLVIDEWMTKVKLKSIIAINPCDIKLINSIEQYCTLFIDVLNYKKKKGITTFTIQHSTKSQPFNPWTPKSDQDRISQLSDKKKGKISNWG